MVWFFLVVCFLRLIQFCDLGPHFSRLKYFFHTIIIIGKTGPHFP